jgi:hypothetical protein
LAAHQVGADSPAVFADEREVGRIDGERVPNAPYLKKRPQGPPARRTVALQTPGLSRYTLQKLPMVSGVMQRLGSRVGAAFLTLESNKEFIDEARCCGHGYVFKMRVYSDLLPALEAALRGSSARQFHRFVNGDLALGGRRGCPGAHPGSFGVPGSSRHGPTSV